MTPTTLPLSAELAVAALEEARTWVGITPYAFGEADLLTGADCSGFVQRVLERVGVQAPRTSRQQAAWARPISAAEARPGDLVFFHAGPLDDPANVHHVGICAGSGTLVECARTPQTVVERRIWSTDVSYGRLW